MFLQMSSELFNDAQLMKVMLHIITRTLFCPTIGYDGNFRQVRKANQYDLDDVCLSDGLKYFVKEKEYVEHLKQNGGEKVLLGNVSA